MYARQTLKLYSFWIIDICVTIVLKVLMVLCIPLILIWSRFGMDWTQQSAQASFDLSGLLIRGWSKPPPTDWRLRSEEHTSELQSLMRISYAVFCLKKKKNQLKQNKDTPKH